MWVWFALALGTHYGARSPYSYAGAVVGNHAARIDGLVVNADALTVRHATQFFYDAAPVPYAKAHNLILPIHSFLVATAASFLRSYSLANYLVNLLSLWVLVYAAVALAESFQWSSWGILLAALTVAAMPAFSHYVGQPMHYIVGIVTNSLVVLAALACERDDVRDPWRLGLLAAVLTLSYDPVVFLAALVTWIVFTGRFRRTQDVLVFLAAATAPVMAWRTFLHVLTDNTASVTLRREFLFPVLENWYLVLTDPVGRLLNPFVAGHLGMGMAAQMTLALLYWPVLLLALAGLWSLKPLFMRYVLPVALVVFFVLEQIATAAYDWENNPRRAIPVMVAFSIAYFFLVERKLASRAWRCAFATGLALTVFLTLADTMLGNPVVGWMQTGEAMRGAAKEVVAVGESRLDLESYPKLMQDLTPRWWDIDSAHVTRPALLLFSNLFVAAVVVSLLALLQQRKLLPRWSAQTASAIFVTSLLVRLI